MRLRKDGFLAQRAREDKRDYITPEDVTAAIQADVSKADLYEELLGILGHVRTEGTGTDAVDSEGFGAEDSGLCCFVAWQYEKKERD